MIKKIKNKIIIDLSNVTYASDKKVYFIFIQTCDNNMAFENLKKFCSLSHVKQKVSMADKNDKE